MDVPGKGKGFKKTHGGGCAVWEPSRPSRLSMASMSLPTKRQGVRGCLARREIQEIRAEQIGPKINSTNHSWWLHAAFAVHHPSGTSAGFERTNTRTSTQLPGCRPSSTKTTAANLARPLFLEAPLQLGLGCSAVLASLQTIEWNNDEVQRFERAKDKTLGATVDPRVLTTDLGDRLPVSCEAARPTAAALLVLASLLIRFEGCSSYDQQAKEDDGVGKRRERREGRGGSERRSVAKR